MRIHKVGRFIVAMQRASDGVFSITQLGGTKYTFPLAIGWMKQAGPQGVPLFEPFTAFTCMVGPFSLAIGYVK